MKTDTLNLYYLISTATDSIDLSVWILTFLLDIQPNSVRARFKIHWRFIYHNFRESVRAYHLQDPRMQYRIGKVEASGTFGPTPRQCESLYWLHFRSLFLYYNCDCTIVVSVLRSLHWLKISCNLFCIRRQDKDEIGYNL